MHANLLQLTNDYFEFLRTDYHFDGPFKTSYGVKFESKSVEIQIDYDCSHSYELSIRLVLLKSTKAGRSVRLNLHDLERCVENLKEFETLPIQASTAEALESSLAIVAEYLRKYCGDFLTGQVEDYQRVLDLLILRRQSYNDSLRRRFMERDAADAWKKKNYQELIRIFEENHSLLSEVELYKLDFARKQIELRGK